VNAIHIICRRDDGQNLNGLTLVDSGRRLYRSCCWDIVPQEAADLSGGWLYLHPTKAMSSEFGGRIVSVEQVLDEAPVAHQERVALIFEARIEARNQTWRGMDHGRAWTGGVVAASLKHEIEATNA
jgi:hypothetical protein